MNMNHYISELDSIKASESFKDKLKELADKPKIQISKPKNAISKIKVLSIAAMFCFVVLTVPTMLWLNNQNHIKDNAQPPSSSIMGTVHPSTGSGSQLEGSASTSSTVPDYIDGLPTLTYVPDNPTLGTPFGFSLKKALDHPWNSSAHLKTMPVFKNRAKTDGAGFTILGLTDEQLEQKVNTIAKKLGVTPTEYKKSFYGGADAEYDNTKDYNELTAICNSVEIKIDRLGNTGVFFTKPIKLPPIVIPNKYYQRKDYEATLNYLYQNYKSILNIKKPAYNFDTSVYGGNTEGFPWLELYDSSGDITQNILSYHFNNARFYLNENGKLDCIWITETDLSEKLGDYPIVSIDEAKQILTKGNFKSWATNESFNGDTSLIEQTELVYHNSCFSENFMPLYRFYVKIPEVKNEDGSQAYNIYYVPAVESKYLKEVPASEVQFN